MSRTSLFRGVRAIELATAMLAAGCLLSAAGAQASGPAAAPNPKNGVAADAANQKKDPAPQAAQPAAASSPKSNASNSTARDPAASANQRTGDRPLPVGRVIYAELMQNIDVRRVKPGDSIVARTTLAVLAHGKVLIAEGARITGHVTEAKARSNDDAESVLGIVFDRAETVDGSELPLDTTVQAIGIGELRAASDMKVADEARYSAVPGPFSTENEQPGPRDRERELPKAETSPALDIGSKGVIGIKAMELIEGKDATHGSLVTSLIKNVKLDNRWQLVLRVIAAPTVSGKK